MTRKFGRVKKVGGIMRYVRSSRKGITEIRYLSLQAKNQKTRCLLPTPTAATFETTAAEQKALRLKAVHDVLHAPCSQREASFRDVTLKLNCTRPHTDVFLTDVFAAWSVVRTVGWMSIY